MRRTLTLENDVAVRLERERRRRAVPFKVIVNEVLRAGLDALEAVHLPKTDFRTEGFSLGQSRVGNFDNIEEVLSRVEGENHH